MSTLCWHVTRDDSGIAPSASQPERYSAASSRQAAPKLIDIAGAIWRAPPAFPAQKGA